MPDLFGKINILLGSGDWKFRNAGLEAISTCGDGCRDVLGAQMGEVIGNVVKFAGDTSPRVRWAVYNCINQLCVDYSVKKKKQTNKQTNKSHTHVYILYLCCYYSHLSKRYTETLWCRLLLQG